MGERVAASGPGVDAVDVDEVARRTLRELLRRPEVTRAGLALVEGAGRRLRFAASDRLDDAAGPAWCLIDAYDDVPLATVVRTGEAIWASVGDLVARYGGFAEQQRLAGVAAVAVLPVPGRSDPAGGIVVYFAVPQAFETPQVADLTAIAREVATAVESRRGLPATGPSEPVPDGALVAVTTVGGDPRAARAARQFLREELSAWEVESELGDVAVLCLSELVTNAVMHTGTPSQLRVTLDADVLMLAVHDHGAAAPDVDVVTATPDADPLRVHGRGLQVIDALARRWGVDHDDIGTTVWVELERAGS